MNKLLVAYIRDLPDIYAHALGPAVHVYQANPSCPCYNLYIYNLLSVLLPTQ